MRDRQRGRGRIIGTRLGPAWLGLVVGLIVGTDLHGQTAPTRPSDDRGVPPAIPQPSADRDEGSDLGSGESATLTLSEPPVAPDAPMIPGQTILPIDLPSALKLAGANDLEIALAKARVAEAIGDLALARSAWLPSLFVGPNWIRHDGSTQIVEGPVEQISKSSLFLGATLAGGNGISGPVPAGGPAPVGNLSTILRLSDAIFEPLAAQQVVEGRRASVAAATNNALLGVSQAYFDLQAASGRLAIDREALDYADRLAALTESFARTGAGLEADYRRSLVERSLRRRQVAQAAGDLEIASAELVRRIRLDPSIVIAPLEPPEAIVNLLPLDVSPDALVIFALRNRPELAASRELVEATLIRLKQARLRPFVPSLAFRYTAGGFGGGRNTFFGNFDGRHDLDFNLVWEIRGLGMADRAITQTRMAQNQSAHLAMIQLQDQVAAEVVAAEKLRRSATRQIAMAASAIPEALDSLELNFDNIQGGAGLPEATRPIEALQPIQALAEARLQYLDSVLAYNRSQFQLYHALGRPPVLADPTPFAPPDSQESEGASGARGEGPSTSTDRNHRGPQ